MSTNNNTTTQPQPPRQSTMSSTSPIINEMTPAQYEALLRHTLQESNRLSNSESITSREVTMAKMINCCIRMLHSHGWRPTTVVRAMVHLEAGGERSVKGILWQALRERRDEERARHAAKTSGAVGAGADVAAVTVVHGSHGHAREGHQVVVRGGSDAVVANGNGGNLHPDASENSSGQSDGGVPAVGGLDVVAVDGDEKQ